MKRFLIGLLLLAALLAPTCVSAGAEAANLLTNGGFEQVNAAGDPDGWYTIAYRTQEGYTRFEITSEKAHTGTYSAKITNANLNDARYVFDVPVQPERMYRVTGYVLVTGMDDAGNGANLAVEGVYAFSQCLFDTQGQWKYVEWYGETGEDQTDIQLGVRVGGYGAESQGTAYFDDVTVQEVQTLPDGVIASLWYTLDNSGAAAAAAATDTGTTSGKSTVLFTVLGALFLMLVGASRHALREGQTLTRGQNSITMLTFVLAMLAAFALRLFLGATVSGYPVDMNCFSAWSLRMASEGPLGFYAEGYFCDYPPGYMLLLWPVGLLIRAVGYADSPGIRLLVKTIPIVCDMAGALILFQYSKKRVPQRAAVFVALLFALNPAALVNGAAWGQVDSVLALMLLLTTIAAIEQNWRKALPLMAVAILLKPQALLFLPVGGIWLLYCLWQADRPTRRAAFKSIGWGVGIAAVTAAAIIVPFSLRQSDPWWLITLYQKTLSSYDYATLNTANLMYVLGGNWSALTGGDGNTVRSLSWLIPALSGLGLLVAGFAAALRRQPPRPVKLPLENSAENTVATPHRKKTARHKAPTVSGTATDASKTLPVQNRSVETFQKPDHVHRGQNDSLKTCAGTEIAAAETENPTALSVKNRLHVALWEPLKTVPANLRKREGFGYAARKSLLCLTCLVFGLAFLISACFSTGFLSYGTLWMVFAYAFALVYLVAEGKADALPFAMALMLTGLYVLGLKIHERYLFAALMLLPLGYARTRDRRLLWLCAGFSVTTFLNTAIVLDNALLYGATQGHLNPDTLGLNVAISIANLLLYLYAMGIAITGPATAAEAPAPAVPKQDLRTSYRVALLNPKDARLRLTGRDYLIMAVTMVLYAALAFTNLGSTKAPQTAWVATSPNETVTLELDRDQTFKMLYYAGVSYNNFSVSVSDDGENWSDAFPCEMREGLCYRWNYAVTSTDQGAGSVKFDDNNPDNILWLTGRYLRVNAESAGLNLWEIILRDEDGNQIPLKIAGHTGSKDVLATAKPPENLIDEQNTLEGEPGWFNGTYFDEIYHARTAYEHLHGLAPYETTHPPLGKLIMSIGIAIFGMTPFGWRFMGTMAGVWMLPALYLLARQLTRKRDLATFVMILFSLDLMHFTQTRIATIDSFPVLFILLSTLCMVRYLMTDVHAVPLNLAPDAKPRVFTRPFVRTLIPLALCGLFMGLSIASKWIGLYSAVGLAVMFGIAVYRQFREGLTAFDEELDQNLTPEQALRVRWTRALTLRRILVTCAFCVLFFIAVPALIYYLSYIPYLSPTGPVTLSRLVKAQIGMYNYQSTPGLGMDHPFYSPWWQWPLILKPMWFCQDKFEPTGWASTIMCMGNPLIYYVGAACMLAMFALLVHKAFSFRGGLRLRAGNGDLTVPLVVLGFLTQYLPWVLVPRSMYMYHYFASVPFIILATALVFDRLRGPKLRKRAMIVYLMLAAVFFALFFPYASGLLTPTAWMDWLKWFPKIYY